MARKSCLLKLVEERRQLKKEEVCVSAVPYIPKDCTENILIRLPLESLPSYRFICKMWYSIINSPAFINSHLRRSKTGLIFLVPVRRDIPVKPNAFSVETRVFELQSMSVYHFPLIDPPPLFYIKCMEVEHGKSTIKEYNVTCTGEIKATCDGLIVLEGKLRRRELIIMNPVTRDLRTIPLGTWSLLDRESYGLAFCHHANQYKLVHLFQDELRFIGCEIMNIEDGLWRVVDGPSFGFFSTLNNKPVYAMGALHWVPHVNNNDYIVSMLLSDEKFRTIKLPKSGGCYDKIVEINGWLGFCNCEGTSQIDVWILKSLDGGVWERQHTILLDFSASIVPLYSSRTSGEIIFKNRENKLYAYDCHLQVMKEVNGDLLYCSSFLPHVNSLVSWRAPVKR